MTRAVLAFVVLGLACTKPGNPPPPLEASSPQASSSVLADAAVEASLPASAPVVVDAGATSRPLPSIDRLAAALRKAKAHGFVAMTRTDARDRSTSPIVAADKLDLDRPVLVASFTKFWTAVAALRMAKRKEIGLDDTIAETLS